MSSTLSTKFGAKAKAPYPSARRPLMRILTIKIVVAVTTLSTGVWLASSSPEVKLDLQLRVQASTPAASQAKP